MSPGRDLFERATSFASLVSAARRAVRGKKHRPEVQRLLFDLESRLLRLHDELRAESWGPGPYRTFTVHEPKQREIAAAPIDDRIVHHAVCAVVEPLFEKRGIHHSYACRTGKGTHGAVRRAQRLARRHRYFLKCDVRKFFDSIDHAVLMGMVELVVDDERLVRLLRRIVEHGPPGLPAGKGLPIGNLTSQHFANLYLGVLDRALCRRYGERRYVRYMDDFLLFGDEKETLHEAAVVARGTLAGIRLALKESATVIAPVSEGVAFLGMRVFPGMVRLQHAARWRFFRERRKRLARLESAGGSGARFHQSEASVFGHLAHANTFRMRTCALEQEG